MAGVTTEELRDAIDNILKGADLNTLSAKKVREQLEKDYEIDLTPRKKEIDNLVMEAITASQKANQSESEGSEDEDQDSASSGEEPKNKKKESSSPPPSKKQKTKNSSERSDPKQKTKNSSEGNDSKEKTKDSSEGSDSEVDDEALARKLQEEEMLPRRRAAAKKVIPRKRTNKKEDSDKPKIRKGTSAYSKKCILSESLAEVVGAKEMARHGVVKRIWEVARERNLFDPKNKRYVICDEQLQKIFVKKKRVLLFGMMKYLKNHIMDSDKV